MWVILFILIPVLAFAKKLVFIFHKYDTFILVFTFFPSWLYPKRDTERECICCLLTKVRCRGMSYFETFYITMRGTQMLSFYSSKISGCQGGWCERGFLEHRTVGTKTVKCLANQGCCPTCAKTVTRLMRQEGSRQRNPVWRGVSCLERKYTEIEYQKWWEDKKLVPWQIEVCGILCLVPKGSDFSEKQLFLVSLNFNEWVKTNS